MQLMVEFKVDDGEFVAHETTRSRERGKPGGHDVISDGLPDRLIQVGSSRQLKKLGYQSLER